MGHQGNQKHFLLVTYPLQGHINPGLQFAKRLIQTGAQVTFVTTVFAHRRFFKDSISFPDSLKVAEFSDGYDDGVTPDEDQYITELGHCGSEALSGLIETFANEGRPVTCLIYALFCPWAGEVAQKSGLPSALLWIQPATLCAIYYYYICGYKELILHNIGDPSYSVQLPGLPLLKSQDLPSFFLPSDTHAGIMKAVKYQFEILFQEPDRYPILVNTFDDLEPIALKVLDKFKLIGVGPFVPSAFLDGTAPPTSGADYIEWLDSKEKSSVVYVSFGSMAVLSGKQMKELARGLVDSGKPFLWVVRSGEHGSNQQVKGDAKDEKYRDILQEEHKGMVVPWCSQVEVLNHSSIGCFVTHCGWSSTLETLSMGVPAVAFPQWSDQGTNAKLIEDDWKMGVRVKPNEEDNIVKGEEIVRCLKEVMEGDKGKELLSNAKKWKKLAREAVKQGGSSESNIRAFVKEIGTRK
ncbi:hypothetical protein ACHQM5_027987 [Ranunculus cassubicifolius]